MGGKIGLFALALLLASFRTATASTPEIVAGAKKERRLVVYTSMTVDQMQTILNAFKAKYPFIEPTMLRAVGERLLTKILTEAQSGRYEFDVVQSAETQAYALKKNKLLARYASPEAKNFPKTFVDPDGYWAAVYIMPNVLGFNSGLVSRAEVPKNEQELLDPKWKGKIGMDPTKPEWFAWMLNRMGREKGMAYMRRLAGQEIRLHTGLSLLTNLLAAGEFPLALNTYLHTVEEVKKKGGPVDWVAFDPVFTKFQPIEMGAKAPHPNAAKLFIDFVLSLEGQKIIASFSRIPTRPGVPVNIPGLEKLNFVVDDLNAAEDFNKNYELFRALFVERK
ncbi:MAG TPA: extracellular solute-binding protein [Candidatus Acidoferrales bacterium]|nr:extracellular solute-binding protein [Candidatus Acidoferrales bacterium]